MTTDNRTTIRNLNKELLKAARKDAIDRDITLGEWINYAIKARLKGV